MNQNVICLFVCFLHVLFGKTAMAFQRCAACTILKILPADRCLLHVIVAMLIKVLVWAAQDNARQSRKHKSGPAPSTTHPNIRKTIAALGPKRDSLVYENPFTLCILCMLQSAAHASSRLWSGLAALHKGEDRARHPPIIPNNPPKPLTVPCETRGGCAGRLFGLSQRPLQAR